MSNEMMTMLIKLQADIGDLKGGLAQAEAAIKGVDDNVKVADSGMKKMIGTLKNVAATMGVAFAGAQLVNFAKDSIMAASSMAESLSKVKVVFDQNSEAVIKWGSTAAENMGISNQAALEAAGTYGNLFQAFGLGQGESQKMSTSLVQLAADMASFNNTSVDDAILALRSGLSGETEPLKRFGVALQDTRLKTEALKMGLIKNTSEALSPAAKAQAAYNIIMHDTALAQGDYARTADGTANTMKTLQAKFADAKVAVGDALMPAFRGLLGILNLTIPVLKAIGNFFKNNQDEVKAFAIAVGVLTAAYGAYLLVTNAATIATKLLNAALAVNPFVAIAVGVGVLVAILVKAYKNVDWFREAVNAAAKFALTAFAAIIPIVGKVYEAIAKIVTGPLRLFLGALSHLPGVGKYAKGALDLINKGLDGISDLADGAAKKARELADGLGKVNKEAEKTKKGAPDVTRPKTETTDPNAAKNAEKAAKEEEKRLKKLEAAADKVKKIYKQMDDVVAEARDKANEALAQRDEKIADAMANYAERKAEIEKNYNEAVVEADAQFAEAVADARARNVEELAKIAKDFSEKKLELEENYAAKVADLKASANERLADLDTKYQERVIDLRKKAEEKSADIVRGGVEKRESIIQQSIKRLTSAFSSATDFSIKDMFKGQSVGGFLTGLKTQLKQSQDLAAGAGDLAGMGYSQTFVEQVMKAGPEAGLKMIDELRKATPEQQKEIQDSFKAMEDLQNTGLDDLAKSMNKGANLATKELRDAYAQVTEDVQTALNQVNKDLQENLAEALSDYMKNKADVMEQLNKALLEAEAQFNKAMNELAKKRDEAIAEAMKKLQDQLDDAEKRHNDALARAQKNLDEALADAQKTLQKSLIDAQKQYEKAIDAINKSTMAKIARLQTNLATVAALIASLGAAQASASALAQAPTVVPITPVASPTTTTTGTTTQNPIVIQQSYTATSVDPYAVTMATISGLKYGQVVEVTSGTNVTGLSAAKLNQLTGLIA